MSHLPSCDLSVVFSARTRLARAALAWAVLLGGAACGDDDRSDDDAQPNNASTTGETTGTGSGTTGAHGGTTGANGGTTGTNSGTTGTNSGTTTPDEPTYALNAPVEVRIDDLGIPHIYAQDDRDLFFAAGYQQAAGFLYPLEMNRRAALGRLAEVLGNDGLSTDIQSRTLGFGRYGRPSIDALKAVAPDDYDALVAYASGVNRRIDEIRRGDAPMPPELEALGVELEPILASELMAIGVRLQFGFSSTLEFDLLYTVLTVLNGDRVGDVPVFQPAAETFIMRDNGPDGGGGDGDGDGDGKGKPQPPPRPPRPDAPARDLTPAETEAFLDAVLRYMGDLGVGEGSNSWSVHGDHTFNGRPILATDSHAALANPNIMSASHLNSADAGGRFDAIGMSFIGIPSVQVGHNRAVAWGATTNFADQTDLWDVALSGTPDAPTVVWGDQEIPLQLDTETIRVRQPDGSFADAELIVRRVPGVGVLLPDAMLPLPKSTIARGELLLGWLGFGPIDELRTYMDLDRAADLDAFQAAIDTQRTGMQNWTAVSASGMRYRTSGAVPDRGPVAGRPPANRVLDGANPAHVWTGATLPRHRLPSLDGDRPYIVTANNDPWGHTADNNPLNDPFYYGSFFAPGLRADHITRVLQAWIDDGVTIDRPRTQTLNMDVFSPLADRTLPALDAALDALDAASPDVAPWQDRPDLRDAIARLQAWDRRMTRDSHDAALFRVWFAWLSRHLLADDLSLLFDAIDDAQPVTIAKFTLLAMQRDGHPLAQQGRPALALRALSDALDTLAQRDNPAWGDLHFARFRAPDRSETFLSTGGDDSSINVAQSRCWDGAALADRCISTGGSVYRMITTIADDGTPETWANVPNSNAGTTEDWVEGDFSYWPFRRDEVVARTASMYTLDP